MKLKKLLSVIYLTFICSFLTFADVGEGISDVGILSSFNNSNTIIITHGYTADILGFPISASKWKHYVWQFAMANAVSNNRDIYLIRRGDIYKIDATYSDFQSWTQNQLNSPIENLIGNPGQFVPSPNKDNVFIFDWTLESAVNKHGYAEAAADILAAELIALGKDYPFLLEHLHFIGHSRGTVVNSETIERLIFWASQGMLPTGINLDPDIHMTTLDPHPAGHWSRRWWWNPIKLVYMDDDKVNSNNINVGVAGWKSNPYKVSYIDNYFQDAFHFSFIGLDNFPGLDFSDPIANNDLSSMLPQNTSAHGLVHTWYHGTVSSLATNDAFGIGDPNIERNDWYNIDLGKTQGFYYSLNRPGNLQNILSIQDDLIDVSVDDKYGNSDLVFNGDFIKGDDVNALFGTDPFPGWSYHDGITPKRGGFFNPSAFLNNEHNLLVHNSLYIPTDVEKIYFRMRVDLPSNVDVLNLYIGNNIIGAYAINNYMFTKKWYDATIPSSLLGTVEQIKFEKTNNEVSSLLIDDVSFLANEKLRSTVACPVNFNIYDQLGNHTGPINDTTFVEEIPGSEYYVYQDSTGDRSKTVYLEPLEGNENYTFIIESRDTTASFDYEIEDYSDTSRGTIIYQFSNIAIEPNTVATCSLDVSVQVPVLEVDIDGDGIIDSIYTPVVIISGVNDESQVSPIPTRYELFNNYPNPFNPTTTISFSIPEVSNVSLKVYDVLGNEIATLVNEEKAAGYYSVQFDSKNLSSGIYIYTLQTGSYTATKKMILLK